MLSRLDGTNWTRKGLRPFLEYRDLGLAAATEGRVGGTIGRAIKKFEPGGGAPRHTHNTSFDLIFVMRGWFRTEFEGLGEVTVRQGDCIAYQGQIPQEHIEYSDDFEVMQIASPGGGLSHRQYRALNAGTGCARGRRNGIRAERRWGPDGPAARGPTGA